MEKREDAYIKLLRMAKQEMNGPGITREEFLARLNEMEIGSSVQQLFLKIYGYEYALAGNARYHISFDAYMSLMDYEELAHSLEESKQARKEAKTATYIAVAAIVVQIALEIFK